MFPGERFEFEEDRVSVGLAGAGDYVEFQLAVVNRNEDGRAYEIVTDLYTSFRDLTNTMPINIEYGGFKKINLHLPRSQVLGPGDKLDISLHFMRYNSLDEFKTVNMLRRIEGALNSWKGEHLCTFLIQRNQLPATHGIHVARITRSGSNWVFASVIRGLNTLEEFANEIVP